MPLRVDWIRKIHEKFFLMQWRNLRYWRWVVLIYSLEALRWRFSNYDILLLLNNLIPLDIVKWCTVLLILLLNMIVIHNIHLAERRLRFILKEAMVILINLCLIVPIGGLLSWQILVLLLLMSLAIIIVTDIWFAHKTALLVCLTLHWRLLTAFVGISKINLFFFLKSLMNRALLRVAIWLF